jgi:hypothetical protein
MWHDFALIEVLSVKVAVLRALVLKNARTRLTDTNS